MKPWRTRGPLLVWLCVLIVCVAWLGGAWWNTRGETSRDTSDGDVIAKLMAGPRLEVGEWGMLEDLIKRAPTSVISTMARGASDGVVHEWERENARIVLNVFEAMPALAASDLELIMRCADHLEKCAPHAFTLLLSTCALTAPKHLRDALRTRLVTIGDKTWRNVPGVRELCARGLVRLSAADTVSVVSPRTRWRTALDREVILEWLLRDGDMVQARELAQDIMTTRESDVAKSKGADGMDDITIAADSMVTVGRSARLYLKYLSKRKMDDTRFLVYVLDPNAFARHTVWPYGVDTYSAAEVVVFIIETECNERRATPAVCSAMCGVVKWLRLRMDGGRETKVWAKCMAIAKEKREQIVNVIDRWDNTSRDVWYWRAMMEELCG